MAKNYYLRQFGGINPIRADHGEEVWYEIWDADEDVCKYDFRGEDAEKKARAKLNQLSGKKVDDYISSDTPGTEPGV
jgi:hypothetical protein